jgi:serine phosphatase RsbU (regulator of sigma subunit)/putative methionine-R-sulfoxide reductase with GAF domain/anti-sigma regulatory factor (Ser/Thr protein kinase)
MRTVIFPARFEQLEAIREFAAEAAKDAGMDEGDIYAVELAIDEACTNIIEHAYEGQDGGDIECTCDTDGICLTVVIRDHGKPFDPSTVAEPDLEADLESRRVGGLGIFLIKQLMDEVHFEPLGEAGNVLTMVKRQKIKEARNRVELHSPQWREIVKVGEELIRTETLAKRRDLIIEVSMRLLGCEASLWLDEDSYRLPGMQFETIFPAQPQGEVMLQALKSGTPYVPKGQKTQLAYPLKNGGVVMGVLEVSRKGQPFKKKEIETLEGLTGHISLALVASQRFNVEQWRIEQLTLVRRVSAQIANVLNMDELTRRVTKLIQRTFNYYYVAVFTRQAGQEFLNFNSSAGQARGKGKPLKVRVGEGLIGAAAEAGQEVVTNDVQTEPRFRFIDVLPQTRSEAVLPLKIEEQVLGVLDIQSNKAGAFHPNDLLVLRALADTISIAINGARLYGELQTRAEHLAVVAEVSNNVTSTLDLEELLNNVASLIQERLGFPYVHLFTVHPNRRQVVYEAGSGAISTSLKGYIFNLDEELGIVPWVARNGSTVLANDVSQEPRYQSSPFPPEDTRAELTIPLTFNQKVVGVLDLQSDKINAFTEEDRFLFEALADNVAAAIHNADLYRTERWRRQVADSLREVTGSVSAEVGVEEVLERVLNELERNLPCDIASVWLLEGEEMFLANIHGAEKLEVEASFQRWPESRNFMIEALAADQPVVRKPEDPMGPSGVALGYSADYSMITAVLKAGDAPLGVITLSHHSPGRYGHEAQAITATFANYAAVAIENARLYDSAQEQAYASAALLQVAQAVANSNNLEETIGTIVRITPILVGVKACVIYLWEKEKYRPTQAYGFSEETEKYFMESEFQTGQFPLLDSVQDSTRMVVGILDPTCAADCLDTELARTDQETYYALETSDHLLVGFPLMIRSDFYGVMLVEEDADTRRFRQKRMEIVTSIAQQVALSIQNDRLQREMVNRERLEHEIQLARQIQQTFLPDHLPETKGWDLAARWLTARQVGGDFYDVFELPHDRLGLFIADVSDKGIPASIFMAVTRTLVRATINNVSSPAETMRRVNALIIPDNKESMFVTAFYGVLSLRSGEFTYANAGHNPPIWMKKKENSFAMLQRTGAALGIIENMPMEEKTICLDQEDLLLLYTDGVTETFSPEDDIYGEKRLLELVESFDGLTVNEMLDAIEGSVRDFMGPLPAADDLTMVAARRRG